MTAKIIFPKPIVYMFRETRSRDQMMQKKQQQQKKAFSETDTLLITFLIMDCSLEPQIE